MIVWTGRVMFIERLVCYNAAQDPGGKEKGATAQSRSYTVSNRTSIGTQPKVK